MEFDRLTLEKTADIRSAADTCEAAEIITALVFGLIIGIEIGVAAFADEHHPSGPLILSISIVGGGSLLWLGVRAIRRGRRHEAAERRRETERLQAEVASRDEEIQRLREELHAQQGALAGMRRMVGRMYVSRAADNRRQIDADTVVLEAVDHRQAMEAHLRDQLAAEIDEIKMAKYAEGYADGVARRDAKGPTD